MTDCENFEAMLVESDATSLALASTHASQCDACAATLADWSDISTTARSLHVSWQSDMLWPRIARTIDRDRSARSGSAWQVAAAAVLTVAIAGGSWFGLHLRSEHQAFRKTILREQALADVETAERHHIEAIEQLEKLADPKLADAGSPLMVSYKEKLMLLDDAIGECQTSIQRNRQNAHLRRQLLAVYSEKQRTLQDVLREENAHVSNQ
jgi:hypothetical protein